MKFLSSLSCWRFQGFGLWEAGFGLPHARLMGLLGTAQPLPMFEADKDKAQLLGDFRLRREVSRQRMGGRVDDIGQGGEHALDDQVGHHVQTFGIQVLELGHPREVRRQVAGDVFAQRADGLPHGQATAVLLAGQEQELRAIGRDHIEEDPHGRIDDAAHDELIVAHQADGGAKGLADFAHQHEPKLVHVVKMTIEPGRHDPGGLGHFAQAQAAKPTATLHQMAGCVHQGEAGLLLLFGAGQHRRAGFVGKYSDAL